PDVGGELLLERGHLWALRHPAGANGLGGSRFLLGTERGPGHRNRHARGGHQSTFHEEELATDETRMKKKNEEGKEGHSPLLFSLSSCSALLYLPFFIRV